MPSSANIDLSRQVRVHFASSLPHFVDTMFMYLSQKKRNVVRTSKNLSNDLKVWQNFFYENIVYTDLCSILSLNANKEPEHVQSV